MFPSRSPTSRRRGLVAVGLFVLTCLAVFYLWSNRIDRGLDGWMKSMEAKGERFTVAGLTQAKLRDTNDCQEIIEAAAAKFSALSARWTNLVTAYPTSVPAGSRSVLWTEPNLLGYDGRNFRWEDFGRELALMTDEFQKLHLALRHPAREPNWDYQQMDFNTIIGTKPGAYVAKRSVAQRLGSAILYELHRTNLVAAQAHLHALVSITILHEQGANLINQMIRVALVGLAASATWEALQAPGWTEPQLADLQAQWQNCDTVQPLIRALEMERAIVIPYFHSFAKPGKFPPFSSPTGVTNTLQVGVEKYFLAPVYRLSWLREDLWFYLRNLQGQLEALREFSKHKSWKRTRPVVRRHFGEYTNRIAGYSAYRYPVTQQVQPNLLKAFETMIKNQTQQHMVLAAIAIKRHQLRSGKLPASLEALVPDYLPAVPVDLSDGQPIRYRANPDGTFLLYACGANLQDDGGDPALDRIWEAPVFLQTPPNSGPGGQPTKDRDFQK